jgi:hypothetical protein
MYEIVKADEQCYITFEGRIIKSFDIKSLPACVWQNYLYYTNATRIQ